MKTAKKNERVDLKLPFRPGVGMMIIDKDNRVFVGKRVDSKANGWQMPQGGIDLGETPSAAALREMAEEIGSDKGYIIAESKKWYSYRLPSFLINKLWNGKYCGQRQKWFLIRFTGQDSDINVNTNHPEFESWRWIDMHELLDNVIPFKHKLYSKIIIEFKEIIDRMYKTPAPITDNAHVHMSPKTKQTAARTKNLNGDIDR